MQLQYGFRRNVLDRLAYTMTSSRQNMQTTRVVSGLTFINRSVDIPPVCQRFVVVLRAGMPAYIRVPAEACASSSVGSNQTSSPCTAYERERAITRHVIIFGA